MNDENVTFGVAIVKPVYSLTLQRFLTPEETESAPFSYIYNFKIGDTENGTKH